MKNGYIYNLEVDQLPTLFHPTRRTHNNHNGFRNMFDKHRMKMNGAKDKDIKELQIFWDMFIDQFKHLQKDWVYIPETWGIGRIINCGKVYEVINQLAVEKDRTMSTEDKQLVKDYFGVDYPNEFWASLNEKEYTALIKIRNFNSLDMPMQIGCEERFLSWIKERYEYDFLCKWFYINNEKAYYILID